MRFRSRPHPGDSRRRRQRPPGRYRDGGSQHPATRGRCRPGSRVDGRCRRLMRRPAHLGFAGWMKLRPRWRRTLDKAGHHAGKQDAHRFADDLVAVAVLETGNQGNFFLHSPNPFPGKPDAIGVPQARLAIVALQIRRSEDKLPVGLDFRLAALAFVVGVDNQGSIDLDGFLTARVEEHQPAAKATDRRPVGPSQHGIGPDGRQLGRFGELFFLVAEWPCRRPLQPKLRAADGSRQENQRHEQRHVPRLRVHGRHGAHAWGTP